MLSVRPGELEPTHPLRASFDAMQRNPVTHIALEPLSRQAVETLAGDVADVVFELSRGNPYFVGELIAHGVHPPPESLANAILGRLARLDLPTRELLELASVVPRRVPVPVLDHAAPGWDAGADQAEQRALTTTDATHLRFRHELTRNVIQSSIPTRHRRTLHRRILDSMLALGADPADIVHHAEQAGATDIAAEHALLAAHHATQAGSNREALAHYRRAERLTAARLAPTEHAALCEQLARSAWLAGRPELGLRAATTGMAHAARAGDAPTHGRCASLRSHINWFRGATDAAWRDVATSIHSLEGAGAPLDLARAYAQSCQLAMLASRAQDTWHFGRKALALTDDPQVRIRTLSAIGMMRMQRDIDDTGLLEATLAEAASIDAYDQRVFTRGGMAFVALWWARPELAADYAAQARREAETWEFDGIATFITSVEALASARGGSGAQMLDTGPHEASTAGPVGTIGAFIATTVQVERAVRHGDVHTARRLQELADVTDRVANLCQIGPVLELQVEHALTSGAPLPVERFAQVATIVGKDALTIGCGAARYAAWARVCGLPARSVHPAPAPYRSMIEGDWAAAAEAFGAIGWHHDRALMLLLDGTPASLTDGLAAARTLGSGPLETRIMQRMREQGVLVPRGPTSATQANPYQLTDRQLEVLAHLRQGHTNVRIGELLHLSPRTVEHHVAAILAKLEVSSRTAAVARALELEFD